MCGLFLLLHLLQLYRQTLGRPMMGAASSVQLYQWLDDIRDCYCPKARPIRPSNINQQQQTPAMLFACPHQRQQRDYTHRHALTAIVTGSISTPKEIYALTLTNPRQRQTNTQIKKISVVPRWHSELLTTVMGHIQPLQLQYIGKAPSTAFIYNIFAVFYPDMSSRYHDIILQLSSLTKLRLEILTWWSHQSK